MLRFFCVKFSIGGVLFDRKRHFNKGKRMDIEPSEILLFQIKRNNTNLFKNFLVIIEELTQDHDEAITKLYNALPDEYKKYVELADYLSDEKCERLRKKVLSQGNDTYRALEEQLKHFDVKLK